MRRLALLLWLVLLLPVGAQSPSDSPSPSASPDEDHVWTVHGAEHESHADVEAGGEYTNEGLDAKSDNYPAIYKFMIRETNSEPYLRKGESRLVLRDAAVVWALNIAVIALFYRRRR